MKQDRDAYIHHFVGLLFTTVLAVQEWLGLEKNVQEIQKEEVKLPLFVNDMIVYKENPEESTKNLLGKIKKFSKSSK